MSPHINNINRFSHPPPQSVSLSYPRLSACPSVLRLFHNLLPSLTSSALLLFREAPFIIPCRLSPRYCSNLAFRRPLQNPSRKHPELSSFHEFPTPNSDGSKSTWIFPSFVTFPFRSHTSSLRFPPRSRAFRSVFFRVLGADQRLAAVWTAGPGLDLDLSF